MKRKSLVLIFSILALTVLITSASFAAGYTNPGEIVSALTGKTPAEVYTERSEGKTYGQIANDNGQLDQFRKEMQEYKKAIIDERVNSGVISRERGETLKKAIDERIAACTGTPGANQGCFGQGFGRGMGFGKGQGGNGLGQGMGRGMGFAGSITK